ncbi:bifunctional diguanylate cyclase/phosphodiesterase [Marinimicrobium sp. ABcell2]|uniref:putative bifunctional diguanylate cyclase/phosphodiesterase n=1 Tax=Marinimicrobium sp. ABcell2 TaxID=3069751 RepID=UPI0027B6E366|nr:EAL domain-containing protein [Marinimicrobium sp. ABcell2]MDQ2076993.1 EAL domain-containing protein [Marinimicrobium sp. ABcell2]
MKQQTALGKQTPYRLKILGLVTGLIALVILAAGFTLATVQIQAAASAYIAGQSVWSRAQVASVHYLYRYAEEGQPDALASARVWLDIPLADREARLAMEARPIDRDLARQALIRGQNHPDDVGRMIWLFRYFSDFAYFRSAMEVWRDSDQYILELQGIANTMEAEWASFEPNREQLDELSERLAQVNDELGLLAMQFRLAMTDASRWMTRILSVVSVGFLFIIALLVWLLGWGLVRALRGSEHRFRAIFEQAAVGMAQVARDGRILDVNHALCKVLDYPKPGLLALRYRDLVHPEDWDVARKKAARIVAGEVDNYTLEQRLLKAEGTPLWVRLTVSTVTPPGGAEPYYIVILEDVSESRRLSVELNYQASHDALTGLYNRWAFERRLSDALQRARTEGTQHALCFIDLDQFKLINDTSGHFAGDHMLRQVVEVFRQTLGEHDMLARLGGDEFGVILENRDLDTAAAIAEQVRQNLSESEFVWQERRYTLNCSMGLVPILPTTPDSEGLLRAADIACFLAKEQGRNRIYVSRENDEQLAEHRGQMEWLTHLREALQENRLFLEAQLITPSVPGKSGLRYEVLVRLRNAQGEVVPPGMFLPAAERFGAAPAIDRWVIEEVFSQLAAHPAHLKGLDACHVNLSGRSFDQPDFQAFVLDALDRHQVPGNKICFEITETAAVNNLVGAITFMETLGQRGCSFALDDFGTGLSSFSYLRRFPVDFLKIDGVFVRDMATDETDLAMVRAINDIGQTLNKITIAEFVEDETILELLCEMGVDYLQGFGIHRPSSFIELLEGGPATGTQPSTNAYVKGRH